MPSLDKYKKMLSQSTGGKARKSQSELLLEATWWEDTDAQVAYLYDYSHDDEKYKLTGLSPQNSETKVPVDIKYIMNSKQGFDKDQVTFHIMMRPSFEGVSYYENSFGKYDSTFPVGMYIDIEDNKGKYNRWLVVDKANYYDNQFSTFEVLPCNYVFQYIVDNIKYQVPGVLRIQSSSAGISTSGTLVSVDNTQKFFTPLNQYTEKLFYDQRMIIDSNVDTTPITWKITNINRVNPNGICRVTLEQSKFDEAKDYIEKDSEGNIIGKWCDYYSSSITPEDSGDDPTPTTTTYSTIKVADGSTDIRINGSNRELSVTFYEDEKEIEYPGGEWSFTINDTDASELLSVETTEEHPETINLKFVGALKYIKKVLKIKHTYEDVESELELEILRL